MTLYQLRIFVAVADLRSFRHAANEFDMSQSAVSHAIASLEKSLGLTLIERDYPYNYWITNDGVQVLRYAREVCVRCEKIEGIKRAKQFRQQQERQTAREHQQLATHRRASEC